MSGVNDDLNGESPSDSDHPREVVHVVHSLAKGKKDALETLYEGMNGIGCKCLGSPVRKADLFSEPECP
ncbi:hypothetical protein EBI_25947 [Enterocytozoon bieneusi H348]|nr:hypothetical protein EBI_25947 [Enterocytozoon bieneusi H348]|eukprot:XP_002651618.1 hypothetical protein EBI_25947 [Enterocytozoon bieneusi H348]